MIPGEYLLGEGEIIANQGRRTVELSGASLRLEQAIEQLPRRQGRYGAAGCRFRGRLGCRRFRLSQSDGA